jgi:cytochrome c biogenesis protein CcdA
MALVVGVLAVATALAGSAVIQGTRRLLPHVNRISGVLLVVVGLYVGYYGIYELRLFLGNGPASDPVVDAAGWLQGMLTGWVNSIGPLPLLLVLALLMGGAVLLGRHGLLGRRGLLTRSRRRHSDTPR